MVSKTTKERVVYWATKLECPVDDNANYENTYVCTTDFSDVPELEADRTIAVVQP
jgi:NCS1 family nucleobase:cation symporter-1